MAPKSTSKPRAGRVVGRPFTGADDPRRNKAQEWVPGQSGNPIGLPKGYAHVRDLAREYTGNAMRALAEVADDVSHPARHQAADKILNRAWGTPEQELRVTGARGGPVQILDLSQVTDAQLEQLESILTAATITASPEPDRSEGGEGEEES